MKIKGAILQKSKPPLIIVDILLSIDNMEKEKITTPEIKRITGTR